MSRLDLDHPTPQVIVDGCIDLVRNAERLTPAEVERIARHCLRFAVSAPAASARLAYAMERICDELIVGRVSPGVSLPHLCAAADLLASANEFALAAATYELDTLLPLATATASVNLVQLGKRSDPVQEVRSARTRRAAECGATDRVGEAALRGVYDV